MHCLFSAGYAYDHLVSALAMAKFQTFIFAEYSLLAESRLSISGVHFGFAKNEI